MNVQAIATKAAIGAVIGGVGFGLYKLGSSLCRQGREVIQLGQASIDMHKHMDEVIAGNKDTGDGWETNARAQLTLLWEQTATPAARKCKYYDDVTKSVFMRFDKLIAETIATKPTSIDDTPEPKE
jgi:hypothetical protein